MVCAAPRAVKTSELEIRARLTSWVRMVIPSLQRKVGIQFEDSLHGFGRDGERIV
jgi:hypothetical protein